jgi:hypothetical protein
LSYQAGVCEPDELVAELLSVLREFGEPGGLDRELP